MGVEALKPDPSWVRRADRYETTSKCSPCTLPNSTKLIKEDDRRRAGTLKHDFPTMEEANNLSLHFARDGYWQGKWIPLSFFSADSQPRQKSFDGSCSFSVCFPKM